MPTPLAGSPRIAFVPAPRPGGSGPSPVASPNGAATSIVFRPASAPVAVDAVLDRFEPPAAAAPVPSAAGGREVLTRPVLLYNSHCEVCQALSSWVKAADLCGEDLIDERPLPDDPEELARIHPDLDIWKAYEEIHLVMPDGRLEKGGAAIAEVLKRLPNTGWYSWTFDVRLLGARPGVAVLHAAYKFLDAIRPALGCSSCGGGPVVWWARPIRWGADLVRWLRGTQPPGAGAS